MHVLDIVQNSIAAGANGISINIAEDNKANTFMIRVTDNGCGMSNEILERVTDPYFTSRTTRKVGMGIPLFKQSAEQSGGSLEITSAWGKGTVLEARFMHDHIDRPELGDISGVLVLLIGANPEIRFRYVHNINDRQYILDTKEIEEVLEGTPVSEPGVLQFIREMIDENLVETNTGKNI